MIRTETASPGCRREGDTGLRLLKKEAIKKANEIDQPSVRATGERSRTVNELFNTESGDSEEMPKQVQEREVGMVQEIAVANEETQIDRAELALEIAVTKAGTKKEKAYVPGPRCSKRLRPRISGNYTPKKDTKR